MCRLPWESCQPCTGCAVSREQGFKFPRKDSELSCEDVVAIGLRRLRAEVELYAGNIRKVKKRADALWELRMKP
jgi:hypothetical protein